MQESIGCHKLQNKAVINTHAIHNIPIKKCATKTL